MIMIIMRMFLFIGSNLCLQWSFSDKRNILQSPIKLSMTSSDPVIDMYYRDQIIIYKDIEPYNRIFMIYCLVSGFGPNSELVYRFCKDQSCPNEWKDTETVNDLLMFYYNVSRVTNPKGIKGMILKLRFPGGSLDASGNFHCEVEDKIGNFLLRSNDIQIRDTYYWSQNIILNKDNMKTIFSNNVTRDEMPITFNCTDNGLTYNPDKPIWYQQLSISPVEWSICPVSVRNHDILKSIQKQTFTKCVQFTTQISKLSSITPISHSDMVKWTSYVNNDGNLHIYDIVSEYSPPQMTFALMCYFEKEGSAVPINTYFQLANGDDIISGVYFHGTPLAYTIPLRAISPLVQNVTLYLKKWISDYTKNRIVSLIALYRASSTAKALWKFNGKQLNSNNQIQFDRYSVKFVGDITNNMAGIYTLDVTDKPDKLAFTFIVTVAGPPTLVNPDCMPLIKYVMEYDSISLNCSYQNEPKSLSLKINSEEIKHGQSSNLSRVMIKKLYPHLYDLNFTTQLEPDSITYQAFSLRKSQGQTKSQDHSVMFFAKNDFGLNLKSSSIYIVPRITFPPKQAPDSYNCTVDCSSQVSHIFRCPVDLDQYANKELVVDHHWTVNGYRLELNATHRFAPYFFVNIDTKELILKPVISNDTKRDEFVKKALGNNFIECHMDLVSSDRVTSDFKYFSSTDPGLKSLMKARITLDYKGKRMTYIYWIVVGVVLLVIVLIVLILLVRGCIRNRLKTYQLEKLELQRGFDPDNESQSESLVDFSRLSSYFYKYH